MYIQNVPYSKLLKLELPRLANRVIEIVEKHDPETLKIKEVFDLLVEEKPQVEGLIVRHGPHPITEELQPASLIILMLLMFAGRLGPLTLAYFIATPKKSRIKHPPSEIQIG